MSHARRSAQPESEAPDPWEPGQRLLWLLVAAVVLSALAVVHVRHLQRETFLELQHLQARRDALNVEWSQLLLEQGTFVGPGRVERVARERLGMRMPTAEQIVTVHIGDDAEHAR